MRDTGIVASLERLESAAPANMVWIAGGTIAVNAVLGVSSLKLRPATWR